ncbi:hypothetical protein HUU05_02085 [candidate division KSB1 bacterium]|nr:hypothetical protein [candidate division KSB1 bacterium]
MIVLDENIFGRIVVKGLTTWYKGQLTSINELRVNTVVKDDAVPVILRTVKQPTFITTNVSDYWRKMPAHKAYCMICFELTNEQVVEIPRLLRAVLGFKEFKTKSVRMGKIVRVRRHRIDYYEIGSNQTSTLNWPGL